jgi:hypothetical protein
VGSESVIELAPPGAHVELGFGVERVQSEDLAVCAVSARRTGTASNRGRCALGQRRLALRQRSPEFQAIA